MEAGMRWLKTTLLCAFNLVILAFLFFVGSLAFYDPERLGGQTGLVNFGSGGN